MTILDDIRADSERRHSDFLEFRREVRQGFERLDARMIVLEGKIADVKADLMKWSFGFWAGAVIAVAVLAKLIR